MNVLQQDLVPLTVASTEEQLRAHLTRNWKAREPIQAALVQAYVTAKSHRYAPIAALDAYYVAMEREIGTTRRQNTSAGSHNAADWNVELKILRLSLEGLDHYTAFSSRWERMSDAQRVAEQLQAQKDEEHKQFLRSLNSAVSFVPQASFNAGHFLQELEGLRIRLTVTGKGDLQVIGANRLTATHRVILASRKADVLQALGTIETF